MSKLNGIVQNVTYVAGQAVHKMGESDTINQIKFLQGKKRTLEALDINSSRISQKIESLAEGINILTEHLDKGADVQNEQEAQ